MNLLSLIGENRSSGEKSPLFTIVTVCRNAEATLGVALQSLAEQSCEDWEWIMIDGASTDGSLQCAEILTGKGLRRHTVSEPDSGIYNAMNKGVRAATGRYVHFLNADDRYADSEVLADVAAELSRLPSIDLLYGNIRITGDGSPMRVHRPPPVEGALEEMICGCLPHQSCFARLELFRTGPGLFDESFRVAADYKWMMDAALTPGLQMSYFDREIAEYSMAGASSQLDVSLPESFRVLNDNTLFQQTVGVPQLLTVYQKTVLMLRQQLVIVTAESDRRARERDVAKEKLAQTRERLAVSRRRKDGEKRPKWLPRWLCSKNDDLRHKR